MPQEPGPNIDLPRLRAHHRQMLRIRAFEERAVEALQDGLIRGAIHSSIGQEAVAAGIVSNLRPDDILLSTHRGHGHTLVKGAGAVPMMRELFGRAGGCCDGKGGSMHIADFGVGMLGANGVVAANIPIAAGAAHAIKLQGGDRIVCCIFGDGATNRGPFLEGLNWAKLFELPVLFVCEDNVYAAMTRTAEMSAGAGPVARAESLGLPSVAVDGNDVLALDEAAQDFAARVRGGAGPHFILARTYRLAGHTAADPAAYRPEGEVEERAKADPIAQARTLLADAGVAENDLDADHTAAEAEMDEALAAAQETDYPALGRTFEDVQDVGDPRRDAF